MSQDKYQPVSYEIRVYPNQYGGLPQEYLESDRIMVTCSDGCTRRFRDGGMTSNAEVYEIPTTYNPKFSHYNRHNSHRPNYNRVGEVVIDEEKLNEALAKIKSLVYAEPVTKKKSPTCLDWFMPHAI